MRAVKDQRLDALSERNSFDIWRAGVLSRVVPKRTALAVIDLQVDFCSELGALASLGSDVSPCKAVAEGVRKFLPRVREGLGLVVHFQLMYEPSRMSAVQRERLLRDGKPIICAPEGSGGDLVLTPAPGDLVCKKYRYSAFTSDEFCNALLERNIETIAVAGVDTHICVEGTVRHGYDLGYRMLVLSDLVGTRRSEAARHEHSLAVCERYFGFVLDSSTFVAQLAGVSEEA